MKGLKKVSVIIVNWNGERVLRGCLDAIYAQEYKNIEVIVVDNNSHDNSVELIKKNYKHVKLVESDTNLGFAGGNNKGLKYVNGDFILLLNSDAIVTMNFLQPLVDKLQSEKEVGVVQPLILYTNNTLHKRGDINSAGTYFLKTGFLYYFGYGKDSDNRKYQKSDFIFTAYGACMLIKKEIIDAIGLFDVDFFMYFEETDFCIRSLLSGWKILYVPESKVYHVGGIAARSYGNSRIYFHSYKNRIASYIKNFELKTLFLTFPVHLLLCEGIAFIYLCTGKFLYFLAVEKAFLWNMRELGSTLRKRREIQENYRKISDDQYLPGLTRYPKLSYYIYLLRGLQYYKE